jgi:hypothetical protein
MIFILAQNRKVRKGDLNNIPENPCVSASLREARYLRSVRVSIYLLKSHHVYEGFINQNIFATKTPRHEV